MGKPKMNQPCPCGSGQKFKKCCFLVAVNDAAGKHANDHQGSFCRQPQEASCIGRIAANDDCGYRFRVGDRVEAAMGRRFRSGTIVALNYQEPGWLGSVPYQISLDNDEQGVGVSRLIYAPFDKDDWVRASPLSSPCSRTEAKRRRSRRRSATTN